MESSAWLRERWKSPVPFRIRSGEMSSLRPRFDRSIGRVFFLTILGAALMLIYGTSIVSGKETSVIVKIQAVVVMLGTLWLLVRLLGSAALRRRFRSWRLELNSSPVPRGCDVAWTLIVPPESRPPEIRVERVCREAEQRRASSGEDSAAWDRSEQRGPTLTATPCPQGWQGTIRIGDNEPGQAAQQCFWRQWLVRVEVGSRFALFPLPDSRTDSEVRRSGRFT